MNETNEKRADLTRRQVLQMMGAMLVVPLAMTALNRCDRSAEQPSTSETPPPSDLPPGATELSPADATAKALGYTTDATKVDPAKFMQFKADQKCENCLLFKSINGRWGNCSVFPNKVVTTNGWCSGWQKKAV